MPKLDNNKITKRLQGNKPDTAQEELDEESSETEAPLKKKKSKGPGLMKAVASYANKVEKARQSGKKLS